MKVHAYWDHILGALALAEKLGYDVSQPLAEHLAHLVTARRCKREIEIEPLPILAERDGYALIDASLWGGNHCACRSTPWSKLFWRENGVAEEWLKLP